ncbi:LPS assembly protein LptD [Pseudoalteromonas tunicata]|uniref:LPS assembly protein LptD n=1 Tax=Pseudoalteromonas tunicata TaxID=314281 RepID=UPI00273FF847|nr:LPS assembly protein LptD [Pseudoalteromonas tunicata]MDP5211879.1 LPS assembly protein LptD [Pseudoalteromonas tunicata]
MNKLWGLLLFPGLCHTTTANAEATPALCKASLSTPVWQPLNGLAANTMDIQADHVEVLGVQSAEFTGDVQINSPSMTLLAQSALIDQVQGLLDARGPIVFQDQQSIISSSGLNANLTNNDLNLLGAQYQLTQQQGRGKAEKLSIGSSELNLFNASYTTCPAENETWSISASRIRLSQEEGWGETYDAVLKIYDTPILYLPYFTYPINDQRKSGFLAPSIGSSDRFGLETKTPYYWNIAHNYDATITPRYMSNIGLQLQTEFRYLTEQHQGLVALEYLNKDDSERLLDERYLFHWQQSSQLNEQWRASIDVTNISDDNYLTDLGSDYANKTDTQLYRTGLLSYMGERWQTDIKVQNFEVLGDHLSSYSAYPQISFSQTNPFVWQGLNLTLNGELSHFKNTELALNEATRLHIEPKAQYLFQDYAWSFLSELSLLQTNYQQKGDFTDTSFEESVSRTLPKLRLYSQINFERETDWLVENGLQTLTPQLQYLYVPNKAQDNIGLYDTTKLQDDFFGLFRDQRYSSVDRIASANQFTLGATTRVFSQQNEELFNLSVGQIFYLSDEAKPSEQKLTASAATLSTQSTYNALFAAEAMLHWHRRWYLSTGVQYDNEGKQIIQSHITLDYKGDDKQLVQVNHRFSNDVSGNRIEQMGLFTSMPINQNWHFIASFHRDLETGRSVELLTGLQYQSCCWAFQVTGHRQIETDLNQSITGIDQDGAVFDSGIRFNFVFKGLGGKSSYDAQKLLQQGIFNYRRPYFLNN